MIHLQTVQQHHHGLLFAVNQKYLYEMTSFYPDTMDEHGNYHYGHFEDYFTDPRRTAYLLYDNDTLIGFAMLCPYSYLEHTPDYTMAEFTIFPAYRRRHFAVQAAQLILERHKGKWEIKFNEKNFGAKQLWTGIAAPYQPKVHRLNEVETVLEFCNQSPEESKWNRNAEIKSTTT